MGDKSRAGGDRKTECGIDVCVGCEYWKIKKNVSDLREGGRIKGMVSEKSRSMTLKCVPKGLRISVWLEFRKPREME